MADVTCFYCNQSGFHWQRTPNGTRLFNAQGVQHQIDGEEYYEEGVRKVKVVGCISKAKPWSADINEVAWQTSDDGPIGIAIKSAFPREQEIVKTAENAQALATQMAAQVAQIGQRVDSFQKDVIQKDDSFKTAVEKELDKIKAIVQDTEDRWTKKLNANKEVLITVGNAPSVNVGVQHREFPRLVQQVKATQGSGIVFLTGEPGSMKTSAVKPLAKALGDLPFYIVSMNNQASRSEIFGYMAGHGGYVPSPLYWVVKDGGVVLYDEIDASNANGLLGINTAAANDFVGFPNGETVMKHKNCYIVAAGNTVGAGANPMFIGRNQLDMATRTRFVYFKWDTDWELVANICAEIMGTDAWAREVQMLHDIVVRRNINFVVSSRVAITGSKMIASGISNTEVLDAMVWPNLSVDEQRVVREEMVETWIPGLAYGEGVKK